MADILHDFPIKAPAQRVFQGVSAPAGLDTWWTKKSSGTPAIGNEYTLWFGPEYDWRAVVSRCVPGREFELKMTRAQEDWLPTRVGFELEEQGDITRVRFHHLGWPALNEHYRISCYCWAMYLRHLRRNIESGIFVNYEERLDA